MRLFNAHKIFMQLALLLTCGTILADDFVTITAPTESSTVVGVPLFISGTSSQPDYQVKLSLNTTEFGSATTDENGDWTFSLDNVSNESYTLEARLISPSFELLATDDVSFTVHNPETIFITSPIEGDTVFLSPASTSGITSLPFGFVQVFLDNTLVSTTTADEFGNWDATVTATSNGAHIITAALTENNVITATSSTPVTMQIPVLNATTFISSLGVGTNGQVLLAATGASPVFATLTSPQNSILFNAGAGSLELESTTLFGKVIRVDSVFGNNSTGQRNGAPFATINAALSVAQSGDTVLVFPGTYAESFTVPNNVNVRGVSATTAIVSRTVSTATDLVTMGENSHLEDLTLTLSSTSHAQLRGVVFPGATSATASIRNVTLTVDNSGAGAGTSNVYALHSTGTGQPTVRTNNVRTSTIAVTSAGSGSKRGVLADSAGIFNINNSIITTTNSGAGSAVAIETNHASAQCNAKASTLSGSTADISQTAGTLSIAKCTLVNGNANSLGFTNFDPLSQILWATSASLSLGGTSFMQLGTGTPGSEMFVYVSQPLIIKSMTVRASSGPGSSRTDTWTLRKNGVDQSMTVSLTGSATSNTSSGGSISFAPGDSISLKINYATLSTTSSPVVAMNIYS